LQEACVSLSRATCAISNSCSWLQCECSRE